MKTAVIGCGNWGKNLVKTLAGLGELHSIVETEEERRAKFAEEIPGLLTFSGYEELLQSDVGAVCIATPVESHFTIAQAVLKSGRHAFVEKPLTLSSSEARSLVHLAEEENKVLMVGHLLLYQPAIEFIKRSLESGLIGNVLSFHQERLNLGRARRVENVLWSLGVHDVASLLFLAGESPNWVVSAAQAALSPGVEDDYYLHLNFNSGKSAHLHCSWLWPELRRRLTAVGSTGMLVYDEVAQEVTHVKKRIGASLENIDNGSEVVFGGASEPLKLELQDFLDCCETGNTPRSDGRSAVDVIEVLERAGKGLAAV